MSTTTNLVQVGDRTDISSLSAAASGIGVSTTCRDASRSMITTERSAWKAQPTPISVPVASMSRQSAASNPFSGNRMRDNLNHARTALSPGATGVPGNRTSSQTVLGQSTRGVRNSTLRMPGERPAKRLKVNDEMEMEVESRYRENGALATDKWKGKGKGKETAIYRRSTASEPEILEDTGQPLLHGPTAPKSNGGKRESPDPIDCINIPSTPTNAQRHPFEAPSKRGPHRRLAEDGDSTLRLQAKQRHQAVPTEPEVLEVLSSSDIESPSAFNEDQGQRRTTPNGRSHIPQGTVRDHVKIIEANSKQRTRGVLDMQPAPPFVDLKKSGRTSIKNGMKPRDAKLPPQSMQQSLGVFSRPLDLVTTSPSGFSVAKSTMLEKVGSIPLQAWSMGCELHEDEDAIEPVAWLVFCHNPKQRLIVLKVVRNPQDNDAERDFQLDRDFDEITYSDPEEEWKHDSTVLVQLRSTKSMKSLRPSKYFKAGDRKAIGAVTFKLMTRHPYLSNDGNKGRLRYQALVDVLLGQIKQNHHVLKPNIASKSCWENVKNAVAMCQSTQRPTRSKASTSRQPPNSAGSSKDPIVPIVERASASAPPSRTYRASMAEQRQTRQSTRSSRASPTPDLDELILVYPFSGTGAVNVTRGDLKRLDPGQYLNDTIIEFGLKVWLDGLRKDQPELAEQVHVFNSFFYLKLVSTKNVAETYASVRKWTSNVDIFSKKYIIVPINENFHWYLAIIENPENVLHPPPPDVQVSAPQTRQTRKRKRDSTAAEAEVEAKVQAEAIPEQSESKESSKQSSEPPAEPVPESMTVDAPESEGEAEVENLLHATQSCSIGEPEGDRAASEEKYPMSEELMDVDASPAEVEKKPPDREWSEPITIDDGDDANDIAAAEPISAEPTAEGSTEGHDEAEPLPPTASSSEFPQCHIYTFDSLGSNHKAAGKHLAHYLRHEAVDKKKYLMEDTCQAVYKCAKAPMQPNFCDCGVFVLAFVEAFMRDPVAASEAIKRNKLSWWDASLTDLRETFRDRTILLSEEWKKERAAKDGAKADDAEDENTKDTKAPPNGKARPSPEVVPDSEEDEIEISAVYIPSKPLSRGGKKGGASKAARLRG